MRRRHSTLCLFIVAVVFFVSVKKSYDLQKVAINLVEKCNTLNTENTILIHPVDINEANNIDRTNIQHDIIDVYDTKNIHVVSNRSQSDVGDMSRITKEILEQTCSNVSRPATVEYSTSHWQSKRTHNQTILVYSAVLDDRAVGGLLPFIRILVVSTYDQTAKLYCHVWYEGIATPYVVSITIIKSGRGDKFYDVRYGQWLYSCQLPGLNPAPSHVSVATSKCDTSTIFLPILTPVRSMWQHEFAVCVPVAFGDISPEAFIEWVEFHKLFGVTEFNIYNGTMGNSLLSVLNYYMKEGSVRVFHIGPAVGEFTKAGAKLSSPASLNDCMLRNIYRYRFLILLDFDEFIIPRLTDSYHDMLQAVDKEKKLEKHWMSYSVRNMYYYLDFTPDNTKPPFLVTMQYRTHVPHSKVLYATKSFIDPKHCLSVFNHFCYVRFPDDPKMFTVDVDTKHAVNQHYRKCNKQCSDIHTKTNKDDDILRFEKTLTTKVSYVLKHLRLWKRYM